MYEGASKYIYGISKFHIHISQIPNPSMKLSKSYKQVNPLHLNSISDQFNSVAFQFLNSIQCQCEDLSRKIMKRLTYNYVKEILLSSQQLYEKLLRRWRLLKYYLRSPAPCSRFWYTKSIVIWWCHDISPHRRLNEYLSTVWNDDEIHLSFDFIVI